MENRKKLTVNISPGLLRALKLEAVNFGATYSDMLASRIRDFLGNDIIDLQQRIKKHQHAGVFIRRGRPSADFIQKNGPIINKKATFYFPESLCRMIRKSCRYTNLPVSSLITLALSYSAQETSGKKSRSAS